MKKGTIYIAGKVTGEPVEACEQKFADAEEKLQSDGWKVINPMKLVTDRGATWNDAMIICLQALLKCDAIYVLECVSDSKGAKLELEFARKFKGFQIFHEFANVEADGDSNL